MHSSSLQGRFIVIFLTILIHEMKLSTGIKENSMFCGPESPDVSRNVFYFNKYFTISHANVKKNWIEWAWINYKLNKLPFQTWIYLGRQSNAHLEDNKSCLHAVRKCCIRFVFIQNVHPTRQYVFHASAHSTDVKDRFKFGKIFYFWNNNARILKAHSHSMSGSSIWASLERQCCVWIAGGWTMTLERSSDWTSTHWVWVSF